MKSSTTRPGFFVSFEGGEGVGKTTQIRRLTRLLRRKGLAVTVTREPGGTEVGDRIRYLLLHKRFSPLSPRSELFLYEASRAQHVDRVILPNLKKGSVVITDRFADSSTVYQGYARKMGVGWVEELNRFATTGLQPDLTIVLDVPMRAHRSRLKKRKKLDRMESEKASFHRRVRKGFLDLCKRNRKTHLFLDGTRPMDEISKVIESHVLVRMSAKGIL